MATQYSQDITTDLEELNYTTVQDLYMWITHCVEKCQLGSNVPNFDIHYKEGEFSCRQEDFDDFKEFVSIDGVEFPLIPKDEYDCGNKLAFWYDENE